MRLCFLLFPWETPPVTTWQICRMEKWSKIAQIEVKRSVYTQRWVTFFIVDTTSDLPRSILDKNKGVTKFLNASCVRFSTFTSADNIANCDVSAIIMFENDSDYLYIGFDHFCTIEKFTEKCIVICISYFTLDDGHKISKTNKKRKWTRTSVGTHFIVWSLLMAQK